MGFWAYRNFETPNHQHIVFYGRVVDQNGTPVPHTTVGAMVLYNYFGGSGQSRTIIQTSENGTFTISGFRGRTLNIHLKKDGYDYEGDKGPFHYTELLPKPERHSPDPGNPVTFQMWKRKGAEPQVRYTGYHLRLPYDGTEARLDFLKGLVKEGGDMIIRLNGYGATLEDTRKNHGWDWDLEFKAIEGGFIKSKTHLMSEAPAEGYIAEMNLGRKMKDKLWWGQAEGNFYAHTRGKLYTKFNLYFTGNPGFGQGTLTLTWHTNPTGSRNLEYEQKQDITNRYRPEKR